MEQINTYPLYLLGKWLDSVFLHARRPLKTNLFAWQSAQYFLDFLIAPGPGRGEFTLNESVHLAMGLSMKLRDALQLFQSDPEIVLSEAQATELQHAIGVFEQALALDLGRAPTYFVTEKGIYSTARLVRLAEWAIPAELRNANAVPDLALRDLNQAGGCLAFGMATASGYHAARSVERSLREYYTLATGKTVIPSKKDSSKERSLEGSSMSDVINALRASGKGDVKILAVLDQLRDLYRNPISHPDVFLEPAEALELFNICTSAISAMARQIIKLRTPSTT